MAVFKKKDRFLGIDLSPTSVKLIELSRSGQRFQIEATAMEPLPDGVMEDRNPTDLDRVGEAIKRAVKASGSRLKKAAMAVPTSSVITRTIPVPLEFGEEEIDANIQVEAAQYIPFPLEEIYLDFQVQGVTKSGEGTQDVMIVASRKENVDLRDEVLREAGLSSAIVDVEAYALENIFPLLRRALSHTKSGKHKDDAGGDPEAGQGKGTVRTAVVDIGATITTLYVFQGNKVIFSREQPFGGDQLTQAIADTYNLPKDRAELAKRSGELSEDYAAAVLEPFKQSAADQINTALQFFFSSSHYNSVSGIILVGGGALVPGLDKTVTDQLGVPTVIGNPFEAMNQTKRVNRRSLLRDGPLYAIACGLALRSLD